MTTSLKRLQRSGQIERLSGWERFKELSWLNVLIGHNVTWQKHPVTTLPQSTIARCSNSRRVFPSSSEWTRALWANKQEPTAVSVEQESVSSLAEFPYSSAKTGNFVHIYLFSIFFGKCDTDGSRVVFSKSFITFFDQNSRYPYRSFYWKKPAGFYVCRIYYRLNNTYSLVFFGIWRN